MTELTRMQKRMRRIRWHRAHPGKRPLSEPRMEVRRTGDRVWFYCPVCTTKTSSGDSYPDAIAAAHDHAVAHSTVPDTPEGAFPAAPVQIPKELHAVLPDGDTDQNPRYWCTICGLADAPVESHPFDARPPCPQCGSQWRWYGRIADRDGTATEWPREECWTCYRWESHGDHDGRPQFGWGWFKRCAWGCPHEHHDGEVWIGLTC